MAIAGSPSGAPPRQRDLANTLRIHPGITRFRDNEVREHHDRIPTFNALIGRSVLGPATESPYLRRVLAFARPVVAKAWRIIRDVMCHHTWRSRYARIKQYLRPRRSGAEDVST